MELHEYYVKQILKQHGLPVLKGEVAYTPEEAREITLRIGGENFWMKPQVMSSVSPYASEELKDKYLAHSVQEVEQKSNQIFGQTLYNSTGRAPVFIQRIYIEEAIDETELFSIVIRVDFEHIGITFSIRNAQQEIFSIYLKNFELTKIDEQKICSKLHIHSARLKKDFITMLHRTFRLFQKYQLMAIELSPVIQKKSFLTIINARLIFDPDALFRFPEIVACREIKLGHEREALAKKNSFRYTNMGGNIACLVNGIGLGLATLDLLQKHQMTPACLLDLGTAPTIKSIATAMRLALAEPNVDAILVNIFGGNTDCEDIAKGLLNAATEIPMGIPVVVRLVGLNPDTAKKILEKSIVKFRIMNKLNASVLELAHAVKEKH